MILRDLPQGISEPYTVDDIWALECDPATENRYFYLLDGELQEDPLGSRMRGSLALTLGSALVETCRDKTKSLALLRCGFHPADRNDTLLMPDVSYIARARLKDSPPDEYVRAMPNIAMEIKDPTTPMTAERRKAETYLRHGSQIVWLVLPEREGVEEWTLDDDGRMQNHFIDRDGALDGGHALPGFTLPLSQLFPQQQYQGD